MVDGDTGMDGSVAWVTSMHGWITVTDVLMPA